MRMNINKILVVGIILVFTCWGISCSNQLSVDEYLQQTQEIIEAYTHATNLETDSIDDATSITKRGEVNKGYAIVEVTEYLYAEEINKFRQQWNEIEPPKEFAEYHSSVADYFFELENNLRTISSCAEELLDGKENDITKLIEAMHSKEETLKQWDICAKLVEEVLLKTSKK